MLLAKNSPPGCFSNARTLTGSHPSLSLNEKRTRYKSSRCIFGRGSRIRTHGTWFWRPLLYQLSYTPIFICWIHFICAKSSNIIHSTFYFVKVYFHLFNQKLKPTAFAIGFIPLINVLFKEFYNIPYSFDFLYG